MNLVIKTAGSFPGLKEAAMSQSIIIYFSRIDPRTHPDYQGSSRQVADLIARFVDADLFAVVPAEPYSDDYQTSLQQADQRQKEKRAPILDPLPDLSGYSDLYIGSPIYWGGMPQEMFTALAGHDFHGKTIHPFTTHEGSYLGSVGLELRTVCPGATVSGGLALKAEEIPRAEKKVAAWLRQDTWRTY
jgi:flavodoxin